MSAQPFFSKKLGFGVDYNSFEASLDEISQKLSGIHLPQGQYRLYAYLNVQECIRVNERTMVFRMNECRVQAARKRKGLSDFPCKPVGLVEYGNFARTIDPRFRTRCIVCPPDSHPEEYWCAWEFTLEEEPDDRS